METPNALMSDPILYIVHAIGRIETKLDADHETKTDHEKRIGQLEEGATKLKVYIAMGSTFVSAAVAMGAWFLEHFWFK